MSAAPITTAVASPVTQPPPSSY